MNIRQTVTRFLHNVADHLNQQNKPVQVPDYITGEMVTFSKENGKAAKQLLNRTQLSEDWVVAMREVEGQYQPVIVHRGSVPFMNAVSGPIRKKANP